MQGAGLEEAGAASTGEEAGLEPWEKIVDFAKDELKGSVEGVS